MNAKRYGVLVWLLTFGLGLMALHSCRAQQTRPDSLAVDHGVRVGWVSDDVLRVLLVAQRDTVERMFQVLFYKRGQWAGALPQDSAYLITQIIPCETVKTGSLGVTSKCPNPNAPTIHTHVMRGAQNSCSPSRTDLTTQMVLRHAFDLIQCSQGVPVWFWAYQNPLRGYDYPWDLHVEKGTAVRDSAP